MAYLYLWYDSVGNDLRSEWMIWKGLVARVLDGVMIFVGFLPFSF